MKYPLRRTWLIFGRSGGSASPLTFLKNIYIFVLMGQTILRRVNIHNLMKQNNNFSILKKIENPLLNPLKILQQFATIDNY